MIVQLQSVIILTIFFLNVTTSTNEHMCPNNDIEESAACDPCWDKSEQYNDYDFDEIRSSDGDIECLDSSTYSLAILTVFIYFIFLTAMVILFHAAMTFRIFSIFTWMHIAAIVFYRASNVFSPSYQQWGLLSVINFFPASIWNSKCLATDPIDQGGSFGIVSITVISIYFIFLGATYYFHHFITHHTDNENINNNNNDDDDWVIIDT